MAKHSGIGAAYAFSVVGRYNSHRTKSVPSPEPKNEGFMDCTANFLTFHFWNVNLFGCRP
jgi:hypothetical protein